MTATTISQGLQRSQEDAIVKLITINYATGQTPLRYSNFIEDGSDTVQYNSETFMPKQFTFTGFDIQTAGKLARPRLTIDNVSVVGESELIPLLKQFNNLSNAIVIYQEIYARHLDTGSEPDATQLLKNYRFRISNMARRHAQEIAFNLITLLDVEQALSNRQLFNDICLRPYRDPDLENTNQFNYPTNENVCPNGLPSRPGTGSVYFGEDGQPTADWRQDKCGRHLRDCIDRFGQEVNLPFQAAPGLGSR